MVRNPPLDSRPRLVSRLDADGRMRETSPRVPPRFPCRGVSYFYNYKAVGQAPCASHT
jgi:hypothetical protein